MSEILLSAIAQQWPQLTMVIVPALSLLNFVLLGLIWRYRQTPIYRYIIIPPLLLIALLTNITLIIFSSASFLLTISGAYLAAYCFVKPYTPPTIVLGKHSS